MNFEMSPSTNLDGQSDFVLTASVHGKAELILNPAALEFLVALQRMFAPTREGLLLQRASRAREIAQGKSLHFLSETEAIRKSSDWRVAPAPADLNERRVEITGPAEPKMMINALNSGASVFMADIEDALSPTWDNVIAAQIALREAVLGTLQYVSPEGKLYKLKDRLATLVVRPRGWHLPERHFLVDGQPMSASLFDFGLFFFNNAKDLLALGTGPYFYLPKLESHLEARLWNQCFNFAQDYLDIPRGTIRATVLIETVPAAFEMEEILFELREHAAGLNAGRWDYLFSMIKTLSSDPDLIFPDRAQLTMTVPFMRAYTERLVRTCHRRGAHAIGGMAAFIPSRRDPLINKNALQKVREDKEREARDGFDGTWVAHPDLVPVAREVFDRYLGERPHQKESGRGSQEDGRVMDDGENLLPHPTRPGMPIVDGGQISEDGVRNNIRVSLEYLSSWLQGSGAVAIDHLMEDAATAEISRSELWQWVHHGARMDSGRLIDASFFLSRLKEASERLQARNRRTSDLNSSPATEGIRLKDAENLLKDLVLAENCPDFMTLQAYEILEA